MKTFLKWIFPLLAICSLTYFAREITLTLQKKEIISRQTQKLPDFTTKSITNRLICQDDFRQNPAVLIYFDPDCDHCQREADELYRQANKLSSARVLLVSSAPVPALQFFAKAHRLSTVPNIQVAHIDRTTAYQTFGFAAVPDLLIYHADGTLSKRFRGETSIDAIKQHL